MGRNKLKDDIFGLVLIKPKYVWDWKCSTMANCAHTCIMTLPKKQSLKHVLSFSWVSEFYPFVVDNSYGECLIATLTS